MGWKNRDPQIKPDRHGKHMSKVPQEFSSGPHIAGLDDSDKEGAMEASAQVGAPPDTTAKSDDVMAFQPPRKDVEYKCQLESIDGLNEAILSLVADYGDILHLFRGGGANGSAADAARKRHRAVISKKIAMEREAQGLPKLSDANLEIHANASEEHQKFCAKLDFDGVQYELVRAQKEALEARRESRKAELYRWGGHDGP